MGVIKGYLYRVVMKIAHRFHWHYAPPIYPDGDMQLWCKWCGLRYTRRCVSRPSDNTYDKMGNAEFETLPQEMKTGL